MTSLKSRTLILFACVGWMSFAQPSPAAPATPDRSLERLVESLPSDWRPAVIKYRDLLLTPDWYLKQTSDGAKRRGEVLQSLSRLPGAESFVLEHAFDGSVPRGSVLSLLYEMRTGAHWLGYGPLTAALEQAAMASPDPDISLAALDAAHVVMAQRVRQAISERKKAISSRDDTQYRGTVAKLDKADERLAYTIEGISLPTFTRTPPPVFQVKAAGPAVRVLAMGDYGTGGQQQHATAATMLALHRQQPFDFGITLGDNFQSFTCEMKSPDDPLWKSVFEDVYGPLGITFYPVFGNHDWACDMPISELLYSARNPHWRFPSPYYTYVAGPVQFFAINTQYGDLHPTASELAWLKAELDKSTAKWKVVYSHFPVFSSDYTDDKLVSRLMPVLRGRAEPADPAVGTGMGGFPKHSTDTSGFMVTSLWARRATVRPEFACGSGRGGDAYWPHHRPPGAAVRIAVTRASPEESVECLGIHTLPLSQRSRICIQPKTVPTGLRCARRQGSAGPGWVRTSEITQGHLQPRNQTVDGLCPCIL